MINYIEELTGRINRINFVEVRWFANKILEANKVFILGNGGSLAQAIHFAQDLQKMCGIRATALDNISSMSAYSNDEDYKLVFKRQLDTLADSEDLVIMFSWSGESKNLIRCIDVEAEPYKIALIGKYESTLMNKVDRPIIIGTNDVQVAEDMFSIYCHLAVRTIKEMQDNESD